MPKKIAPLSENKINSTKTSEKAYRLFLTVAVFSFYSRLVEATCGGSIARDALLVSAYLHEADDLTEVLTACFVA